jgi:hypothetical protein
MIDSAILPIIPLEHPTLDYAFLRQEGIRHLERLSGRLWTDFNSHDPGITILEQLCYALTDLGHRINYKLPDLLAGAKGDGNGSLYGPAQILSSHPLTLPDLRKLIIDVTGIRNAWIEEIEAQPVPLYYDERDKELRLRGDPLEDEPVYLKGLYRILLEVEKELAESSAALVEQVTHRLHANRSLCQDFTGIEVLAPLDIQVEAQIEIEAVEDVHALMLQIYHRLGDHISPPVRFYSLSQMLASGRKVDEIYQGPLLKHGFVDDDELMRAQRRDELRVSDLIREIMDVPGVRAVHTINIAADKGAPASWTLRLDSDPLKTARLDREGSLLRLERNGLPVGSSKTIDWASVIPATATPVPATTDLSPLGGRDRRTGHYYSLQHQFPATYGIGALGLPDSASPQRQAQARQLKAYLLFFDQILANYFAQLSHVGDLFSFFENGAATYFSQDIDDPSLGLDDIRRDMSTQPNDPQQSVGDYERRNRFLNHLLARFAEQFTDYSLILYGAVDGSEVNAAEKLVHDKQDFLQTYPQISSARGLGMNALEPWSDDNRSGLEKRLRRKLGIIDSKEDFYLLEHILLRPLVKDVKQFKFGGDEQVEKTGEEKVLPILDKSHCKDPYSLQLSFVFPEGTGRYNDPAFKSFVERTVRQETPAHLFPTIHWLDAETMDNFAAAYKDWLAERRIYLRGN